MESDTPLVHNFEEKDSSEKVMKNSNVFIFLILAVLGVGTGYFIASMKKPSLTVQNSTAGTASSSNIQKGATYGSADEKTFKDSAEGILKMGGIEGEGAFHLERPGGESQNVYMTSSTVDLSQFVNKKVKVWGQTNTAKKAGWLMDVGRLQVL